MRGGGVGGEPHMISCILAIVLGRYCPGGGGVIVLGGNFPGGSCPRDGNRPDTKKRCLDEGI